MGIKSTTTTVIKREKRISIAALIIAAVTIIVVVFIIFMPWTKPFQIQMRGVAAETGLVKPPQPNTMIKKKKRHFEPSKNTTVIINGDETINCIESTGCTVHK